jgi:hypothetical protein
MGYWFSRRHNFSAYWSSWQKKLENTPKSTVHSVLFGVFYNLCIHSTPYKSHL